MFETDEFLESKASREPQRHEAQRKLQEAEKTMVQSIDNLINDYKIFTNKDWAPIFDFNDHPTVDLSISYDYDTQCIDCHHEFDINPNNSTLHWYYCDQCKKWFAKCDLHMKTPSKSKKAITPIDKVFFVCVREDPKRFIHIGNKLHIKGVWEQEEIVRFEFDTHVDYSNWSINVIIFALLFWVENPKMRFPSLICKDNQYSIGGASQATNASEALVNYIMEKPMQETDEPITPIMIFKEVPRENLLMALHMINDCRDDLKGSYDENYIYLGPHVDLQDCRWNNYRNQLQIWNGMFRFSAYDVSLGQISFVLKNMKGGDFSFDVVREEHGVIWKINNYVGKTPLEAFAEKMLDEWVDINS